MTQRRLFQRIIDRVRKHLEEKKYEHHKERSFYYSIRVLFNSGLDFTIVGQK